MNIHQKFQRLHKDLDACLITNWLTPIQADNFFDKALTLPWERKAIQIFNKKVFLPRKVMWMADKGVNYGYSGIYHRAQAWVDWMEQLRQKLINDYTYDFNSVLGNLYTNGFDYVGYHQDNEIELGQMPTIASLSLGAVRRFLFKNLITNELVTGLLPHGSLLFMWGNAQESWKHSLPRAKKIKDARVNFTFRQIKQNIGNECDREPN